MQRAIVSFRAAMRAVRASVVLVIVSFLIGLVISEHKIGNTLGTVNTL